jgi:hypothetical protein
MRTEHWATNKRASVDATFSAHEAERAILERMRRSAEWAEHERFHRETGGRAELVLHTQQAEPAERTAMPEQRFDADEPQTRARPIIHGGCQCQSPSVRLVLGEDGDVENKPFEPIETNSYGVATDDTPTYGSGGAGSGELYKSGGSEPTNLYK